MAEAAPGPLVLLVDDDPGIRRSVATGLELEGFRVVPASGGRAGLAAAASQRPDVVLLDLAMPDLNGLDVLRELRDGGDDVPVCILSARDEVDDRVRGLEVGADDYVVKPFALEEVAARLHALLRRRPAGFDAALIVGDLELSPPEKSARRAGRDLGLTRREFELLHLFLQHPGEVLERKLLAPQHTFVAAGHLLRGSCQATHPTAITGVVFAPRGVVF